MRLGKRIALGAVVALAAQAPAQTHELDPAAVQRIVREYLLEQPEVLEEAIHVLRTKREREKRTRAKAAIRENLDSLLGHPLSAVSGNPGGDVTLVEFFDYQCGYCKRSLEPVMELLESDTALRIVWKELPVLGPISRFAARASMAAQQQGQFLEFHVAVMGTADKLSEERVMAIAEGIALDVERLRRDMADPALEAYLDETYRLATSIGVTGTPAFVIGDTLVPGAVDGARLKELIAKARDAQ